MTVKRLPAKRNDCPQWVKVTMYEPQLSCAISPSPGNSEYLIIMTSCLFLQIYQYLSANHNNHLPTIARPSSCQSNLILVIRGSHIVRLNTQNNLNVISPVPTSNL
ncbi:hypothetical protein GJ496_004808 [Pomphorhynchus laevis]|nr:hypothetical protein GJ496_004808 [Pomphorhynchus laevis]